jgi:hypothetical protein
MEPGSALDASGRLSDGSFEIGELQVGHLPAPGAHQVVVVLGQRLVELEAGEPLGELEADQNARVDQVGDDPVERRQRNARLDRIVHVLHGQGRGGPGEGVDHPTTSPGPALARPGQAAADLVVHSRIGRWDEELPVAGHFGNDSMISPCSQLR